MKLLTIASITIILLSAHFSRSQEVRRMNKMFFKGDDIVGIERGNKGLTFHEYEINNNDTIAIEIIYYTSEKGLLRYISEHLIINVKNN